MCSDYALKSIILEMICENEKDADGWSENRSYRSVLITFVESFAARAAGALLR